MSLKIVLEYIKNLMKCNVIGYSLGYTNIEWMIKSKNRGSPQKYEWKINLYIKHNLQILYNMNEIIHEKCVLTFCVLLSRVLITRLNKSM